MLIAPTIVLLAVVIGYPVDPGHLHVLPEGPALDPATGIFVEGVRRLRRTTPTGCSSGVGDVAKLPARHARLAVLGVVWITSFFTVVTVAIELGPRLLVRDDHEPDFKGRGLLRAAVLIPWAIPTAVTAKLWYFIFAYDGIANSDARHPSIVWIQRQVGGPVRDHHRRRLEDDPFMALLILAGLQLIPRRGLRGGEGRRRHRLAAVHPDHIAAGEAGGDGGAALPHARRAAHVRPAGDHDRWRRGDGNDTTTLSILVVNEIRSGFNSAAALSTSTFLFIFAVAFMFIKFLGANVVRGPGEEATRDGRSTVDSHRDYPAARDPPES